MNANIQSEVKTDETEIRQLTEKWRSLWSPQDRPFTIGGAKSKDRQEVKVKQHDMTFKTKSLFIIFTDRHSELPRSLKNF